MTERDAGSWIGWTLIAGTLAVCCALPIIALIALAAGGIATLLTGAIWLSIGATAVAVALVGVYFARGHASKRVAVFIPQERQP